MGIIAIGSTNELRYAYESIARMYQQCDRIAADTTGDPSTRTDEIEGVRAMIRIIERQIAAYYTAHPEIAQEPASVA